MNAIEPSPIFPPETRELATRVYRAEALVIRTKAHGPERDLPLAERVLATARAALRVAVGG